MPGKPKKRNAQLEAQREAEREERERRVEAQLNKAVRNASEGTAKKLKDKNKKLYDKAAVAKDIEEINALLGGDLSDEERLQLEMIQARNRSSELILDEKLTGDKKQIQAVKTSLASVEKVINQSRLGIEVKEEELDKLLVLYDQAILACRNYMRDNHATNKEGQEHQKLVRLNILRLHREAASFQVAKELMHTGVISGEVNEIRDLMTQAKGYGLRKGGNPPKDPEQRRELPNEETVKAAGVEASLLYRAFSGEETPSDMIGRLAKSTDEKEQSLSREMARLFFNLRNTLMDFKEGKVQAKVFLFGDTVLRLHQNTHGQLTLHSGETELPLERNTGILRDMLTSEIVNNESVYGKKASDSIVKEVINGMDIHKPETMNRQLLTDYLVNRTGYKVTDYTNFLSTDLAYMIRCIQAGKKLYILDSEPDRSWEFSDDDVIFTKEHSSMINVMESREILQNTQDQANRARVQDMVSVGRQEKEEPNEWTDKEKKILNLMGDLLFSYDSWTADEMQRDPGERMKLMLVRNKEAVAYLVSDMFATGDKNMKIVNGILDKMPLFVMEPEKAAELRKAVTDGMTQAASAVKSVVDSQIDAVMGKRPDGLLKGLLYDSEKGAMRVAAQGILTSPDSLLKGVQISKTQKLDGLEDILKSLDDQTVKKLAGAETMIDSGVKATSQALQQTVSKYSRALFNPAAREAEEALPNPYEPGLSAEEVRARKREKYEKGNERLAKMVKDSMTAGESGQGLFTRLVFEKYFEGVDTIDQRAMLASMIREAKPVGKLEDENAPGLSPDEKTKREARNNKVKTESMGNYIGGLLKGAGPLFQKMMQGLPMEGLPEELKSAVKDMKSKLAPIPDEIVEAQLYSMTQRSHGQVKNIKVEKPLGAASVGQTFLCKISRADGTEEEAAVKLLKPDVTNRMMREKNLMISCARLTDIMTRNQENRVREAKGEQPLPPIKENEKGGMQATYEGQLERIQEELDLKIEARNVELGKVYDKGTSEEDKKVTSMKLNKLIAPTTNSMVLEKAPGETVDALLERMKTETTRLKELYRRKLLPGMSDEVKQGVQEKLDRGEEYYKGPVYVSEDQNLAMDSDEYARLAPDHIEEKLGNLLAELKKKKKYLDTFARKWTEDGLFKEGFYHGDPHDGNIMVSDEGLTVIDFGNCTKLTEHQQLHVTRMMAAAATANMELFRSSLHALLKPEFEGLYQKKRTELGRQIRDVFALGDQRSAGARIMVALLKAQELGLEIPSAVYNFSQGQIRLQNALSNMNHQIEEIENTIGFCRKLTGESSDFDITLSFREKLNDRMSDEPTENYLREVSNSAYTELVKYTNDKDEFKKALIDHYEDVKGCFINPLLKQAGRKENAISSFRDLLLGQAGVPEEMFDQHPWEAVIKDNFAMVSCIVDETMQEKMKLRLRDKEVPQEWKDEIIQQISDRADKVRESAEAFKEVQRIRDAVTRKHKGEWKPTKAEKARFEEACGRFAEVYTPLHSELAEGRDDFRKQMNRFRHPADPRILKRHMTCFFKLHPEGRDTFMTAYNSYQDALKQDLEKTNPNEFREKEKNLATVYHNLMVKRLREKSETYKGASAEKKVDFLSIMSDVIETQVPKFVKRMGYFRSLSLKWKLNKQAKEAKQLGIK